jgi:hypothetical protein
MASNCYTREIESLLGCGSDHAFRVFEEMQIDFSECSKREFNEAARAAHAKMTNATMLGRISHLAVEVDGDELTFKNFVAKYAAFVRLENVEGFIANGNEWTLDGQRYKVYVEGSA